MQKKDPWDSINERVRLLELQFNALKDAFDTLISDLETAKPKSRPAKGKATKTRVLSMAEIMLELQLPMEWTPDLRTKVIEAFRALYDHRIQIKKPVTALVYKRIMNAFVGSENKPRLDVSKMCYMIEVAISEGWQGIHCDEKLEAEWKKSLKPEDYYG